MKLQEIAKALRENAEHLEHLDGNLCVPVQTCDVRQAFQTLIAAFPDITITILPPNMTYYAHSKTFGADKWGLYIHDGKGTHNISKYEGVTLAEAVNAALASLKADPDPVASVEAALNPAAF